MKKLIKFICFALSVSAAALYIFAFSIASLLPDTFLVTKGEKLTVSGMPFITAKAVLPDDSVAALKSTASENIKLTIGGVLPVKTVRTRQVNRRVVTVCGTPFGIKMFANGAMIVSFSDIYTKNGYVNPAKMAGLRIGDVITSVAGQKTKTNEDVARSINKLAGAPAQIEYIREGKEGHTVITAVIDMAADTYRTGMWVRDSSAGIGTLTFVDNTQGVFAGLGHPIHDVDTGLTIGLDKGEIVNVNINGCTRSETGTPGELKGQFVSPIAIGSILENGDTGVYGDMYAYHKGMDMELALPQEVHSGAAQLITTINGNEACAYSVNIEKISLHDDKENNRNMVIHITDERLLNATGGIVQGMSGSPIVQDGCIVGAVTHVLVGDPTRGYAIFAKTMLSTADAIAVTDNAA